MDYINRYSTWDDNNGDHRRINKMKKYPKISGLYPFNGELKQFDAIDGCADRNVELLKNHMWLWSEKVDGTNIRLYWDGYDLYLKGRTDKSQFSADQEEYLLDNVATDALKHLIEQMFKEKEVYIYGELHGKNIQKVGKLYSEDYQFRVFDIEIDGIWLERHDVQDLCGQLGLKHVPYILEGTIGDAEDWVMENKFSTFSDAPLEGLVGIPVGGFLDRQGKRIAVKVKYRDLKKTVNLLLYRNNGPR